MKKLVQKIRNFFGSKAEEINHSNHATRFDRVVEAIEGMTGIIPSVKETRFIGNWLRRHDEEDRPQTFFWVWLGNGKTRLTFRVTNDAVSIRDAFSHSETLVA